MHDVWRFGITPEGCSKLIALYSQAVPDKLAKVFDDLERTTAARAAAELRSSMEEAVSLLCERAIARLG